jgi:hypothetical protein
MFLDGLGEGCSLAKLVALFTKFLHQKEVLLGN